MKFLFTSTPFPTGKSPYWCPELMTQRYLAKKRRDHELVDNPEEADAIIYFEPSGRDEREEILRAILRSQAWVQKYPNKCFVADCSASPIGWLPGVYTSMPANRFDPERFRAMGYLVSTNARVSERSDDRARPASCLCSFRGARMPGVRATILDRARWGADFDIIETPFLENWSRGDNLAYQDVYVDAILDSRFVLCPRGYAASTFRMYEVMELGRVPVVLSDLWVPPSGPDWNSCVLRVSEEDWRDIPRIVRAADVRWKAMAARARQTWENWFCDELHIERILEWIATLAGGARPDEREARARWPVQEFVAASLLRKVRG